MQKIFVLFSFVIVAFLTGCSSSPTSPANNNNNNNSTDTSSYLPLATGNSWTYTGSAAGTYTVSIIGDTTFGGYSWKIISNSASTSQGYIRKQGIQYREMAPPGYIIPGEVTALDETPGASWIWDISTQAGVTEHYVYTNASQGLTRIVLGKTYTNVIDVRMDFTFSLSGQVFQTGTYNYYYAKGIGLIDSDLGAQGDEPLSSYTLK